MNIIRMFMKKNVISLIIFTAIFLFLTAPHFIYAAGATLSFSPASGTYNAESSFPVNVVVDSSGAPINAIEAAISFDSSFLSVSSISKTGSALTLWTAEPVFSNTNGTINFGGGNPSSFSQKSTLITINFKAKKEGTAKVSFSSGFVLAADGKGTDILSQKGSAAYTIQAKSSLPSAPSAPSQPKGTVPEAPVITSSTHPDPEKWYATTTALLSWNVPSDVTGARLLVGKKAEAVPSVTYIPPVSSKEISGLEDGIWYFHVRFQNKNGWGEITHRKILVDVSPPKEFEIKIDDKQGDVAQPVILFSSTDALSGISKYEIKIGDGNFTTLNPDEIKNGYKLPEQPSGKYTVTARAVDQAGNVREATKELEIIAREASSVAQISEEGKKGFFESISLNNVIIFLLVIIIIAMFFLMSRARRSFVREKEQIRQEANEAKEKMVSVFAALRDEAEEQVNALDKKERLSEAENRMLNKLKEALDISEEFIDKEIEDVQKMLKK